MKFLPTDAKLIDALKQAFEYSTDVEVAGFLGVDPHTIYMVRKGDYVLGERQRFKIMDKVLYRSTENLALRCLPKNLAQRIFEIRRDQAQRWALKETEDGAPPIEDSQLLGIYKEFRGFKTDKEMAEVLGIKPQSISMVRSGKNRLGPLPRLRIFRDVWGESVDDLEAALQSSEALLKMVNKYIEDRQNGVKRYRMAKRAHSNAVDRLAAYRARLVRSH